MSNRQIIAVNNIVHKHAQFISNGDTVVDSVLREVVESIGGTSFGTSCCKFYWNDIELKLDLGYGANVVALRVNGDGRLLSEFIDTMHNRMNYWGY